MKDLQGQFVPYAYCKMMKECGYILGGLSSNTIHNPSTKIFYPDPEEANNCAQCGKSKAEHDQFDGRPFFCEKERKLPCVLWQQAEEWLWEKFKVHIETTSYETLNGYAYETIICKGTVKNLLHQPKRNENHIHAHREGILNAIEHVRSYSATKSKQES